MVSRRLVLVLVLVLGSLRAEAGVGDELDLMAQLRSPTVRDRETAARVVAARAAAGDTTSILIARMFAVTDDLTVHVALVDALAAAGVIAPYTRAFVPRGSVLERRLRQQFPAVRPERLPRAARCRVVGWTPRGAQLECTADPYCGPAGVVDRTFSITTGARWEFQIDQRESGNDRCPGTRPSE